MQAGVAAGIPVIGLTTGQEEEALREAGATMVCRDFSEIMKHIQATS
jgi:phosphoglycolate phosphatase-like HAD superfamily hydrolase